MLTGTPPFTDADIRTTRRRHLHDSAPPLPAGLEAFTPVLERCIAKNPDRRFESALALKDALSKLWKAAYASRAAPPKATKAKAAEGRILGTYELIRCIGEGAMGAVYEGRHTRLDRKVALKVLKPELSSNESFVERFFQEAKAANRIRHENIVEIQDYIDAPGDDSGLRYACVMELLEGQSLGQVLRAGPITLDRVLKIALQTTSALQAAHAAGIIHRDIKPDNIFLTRRKGETDFVKVLDFGIAKMSMENDTGLTRNGEILGTPEYMAPEQLAGRAADARSDIYSFGSVLYRMICGRPPFKGRTLGEQLSLLVNAQPRPLEETSAAGQVVPQGLRKLVLRCLEKKPEARPQSMADLSNLLRPFLNAQPEAGATEHGAPEWGELNNIPLMDDEPVAPEATAGSAPLELDRPKTPFPAIRRDEPTGELRRTGDSGNQRIPGRTAMMRRQEDTGSNRITNGYESTPPRRAEAPPDGLELARPAGRTSQIRPAELDVRIRTGMFPAQQPPMRATSPASNGSRYWVASAAAVILVVAGASYRVFANVSGPEQTQVLKDLSITSVPTAVDVYRVDTNELLGITPFRATFRDEAGSVMLRFERKGFSPIVKTVTLGEDANVHAVLPIQR
jgi:serine/threonine protein kinase